MYICYSFSSRFSGSVDSIRELKEALTLVGIHGWGARVSLHKSRREATVTPRWIGTPCLSDRGSRVQRNRKETGEGLLVGRVKLNLGYFKHDFQALDSDETAAPAFPAIMNGSFFSPCMVLTSGSLQTPCVFPINISLLDESHQLPSTTHPVSILRTSNTNITSLSPLLTDIHKPDVCTYASTYVRELHVYTSKREREFRMKTGESRRIESARYTECRQTTC